MEAFLPDHKMQSDEALLRLPEGSPLTPPTLFTCTYVGKVARLKISFVELTALLVAHMRGALVAFNSNFGHAAQPGYESLIKRPKVQIQHHVPARNKPRKMQGDGSCFNSTVEPIIKIAHPGSAATKVYKLKCFSTTGELQVPGVLCPDLSDGRQALRAFVAILNEVLHRGADDAVTIESEAPSMMNYKFMVRRTSPRILVDLHSVARYMRLLEDLRATEASVLTAEERRRFAAWGEAVLPPFPVRETKGPAEDAKASFKFAAPAGKPRVNVFQQGKIDILGAKTAESAQAIHAYFARLFAANWRAFICLKPLRDHERLRPPPRPPLPPAPAAAAPPAAPRLTDAEVDAICGWDPGALLALLALPPDRQQQVLGEEAFASVEGRPSLEDFLKEAEDWLMDSDDDDDSA